MTSCLFKYKLFYKKAFIIFKQSSAVSLLYMTLGTNEELNYCQDSEDQKIQIRTLKYEIFRKSEQ